MIILVTGGARSGKSRIAEERCLSLGQPASYIATAEIFDDEMRARIDLHRARRGAQWRDYHAPLDLAGALRASDGQGPRLVDCLTMWLNNVIYHGLDLVVQRWRDLIRPAPARLPHPVVSGHQ
ncbi:MAG: bifunctional adenosylcobinamide kinase/adenosylcobinamide-phosphate guanylyltransferase [Cypionkella sp.]|nr:bifunctional adenosylcobinamide kinase/adenosylcobinamide-phosphate guanylyltransferase [Cypionkella sp.]